MNISLAFRISAVLWFLWGAVHALAGITTLVQPAAPAVAAIADAIDPATLAANYHPALEAIVHQHGFNLLWFGLVTAVAAVYIWRGSAPAIYVAALVGGLADLGYFVFIDLGGFNHFAPGTVMTIISAAAVASSVPFAWRRDQTSSGEAQAWGHEVAGAETPVR